MNLAVPLAERMRPETLDDVVGHHHLIDANSPFRRSLAAGALRSILFWGPPGCGKTTLARLIAHDAHLPFRALSATLDGTKEIRAVLDQAKKDQLFQSRLLVFVDEIHRWNKTQQDILLPEVETGNIILIGATTENPSFEVNAALLSRMRVWRLEAPSVEQVKCLLQRALLHDRILSSNNYTIEEDALISIAQASAGDCRQALSDLEFCISALNGHETLDATRVRQILQHVTLKHDKHGESHYNIASAFIKSMRGSDPQASIYWLARLLEAGEDPKFIARRMIIFASEDVGNADPRALGVAIDAARGLEWVGLPEARIILSQAVLWLATSPKSNSAYLAIGAAIEEVQRSGNLPVPHLLRSAEALPKGHEKYKYPHDYPHRIVEQEYLPYELTGRVFYTAVPIGEEKRIAERLAWWKEKLSNRS